MIQKNHLMNSSDEISDDPVDEFADDEIIFFLNKKGGIKNA